MDIGQGPSAGTGSADPAPAGAGGGIRLHIGGRERTPGWTVLDIVPGPHVDIIGNCADLGQIADGACAAIYASHVIEHLGYDRDLPRTLEGFHRVLAPGGLLMVSVPDLDALCRLFTRPDLAPEDRFMVMRMMFGGRIDAHDVHLVGLNGEFLSVYLMKAGFADLRRVEGFGLFHDTSTMVFKGTPISLNIAARKPA
jgi:predicted SAM-dependent methyltransferase